MDRVLLDELLGPLHMHFLAAKSAYQAYLDNGRTFLFAAGLRRINLSVRALLLAKGYLLPDPLQPCATALVGHYDVWLTLWEDLAERSRPAPSDRFVFENRVTYPREAEQALERLYEQLRQAGVSSPA
ncbi:MAG TPA: hypothetical protein VN231_03815 [Allosphingosinicella sp.]|nr:hypothetical protein [Allosphingosinicella sp.]